MDTTGNIITTEATSLVEKEGLPVEAFAKVQEFFNDIDWLDHHGAAQHILRKIGSTNSMLEKRRSRSPQRELIGQNERLELAMASGTKPMLEKHSLLPPGTCCRMELEETSTLLSMQENHDLLPLHAYENMESEEKGLSVFLQDKHGPLSPLQKVAFPKEREELDYNIKSEYVQEKHGPPSSKSEAVIPHERFPLDKKSALEFVQECKMDTKNEVIIIPLEKDVTESPPERQTSLPVHEAHVGQINITTSVLKKLEPLYPQTKVAVTSDKVQCDGGSALNSIQENPSAVSLHRETWDKVQSDEVHAPKHVQEKHGSAFLREDLTIVSSMPEKMKSGEECKCVLEPVQEYMPFSHLKDEAKVTSEQEKQQKDSFETVQEKAGLAYPCKKENNMTAEKPVKKHASDEQQKVALTLGQEKHVAVSPQEGTKDISRHVLSVEQQKCALGAEPDMHKSFSSFMDGVEVLPVQILSKNQLKIESQLIEEKCNLISSHQDTTVELKPTVHQDKVVPVEIVSNDQQKIGSQSIQEKSDFISSCQDAAVELVSTIHQDKLVVQKKHNSSYSKQGRDESVLPLKDQEPIQQAENVRPALSQIEAKSDDIIAENQTSISTSLQGDQDASMPIAAIQTALDNELPQPISTLKFVTKKSKSTSQKQELESPSGSSGSTCISPPADIKSEQIANQQLKPKIISQRIPLSRSTLALGITDLL
jgi:hypothetical protein